MPSWFSVGKSLLFLFVFAVLCWFALGQYLHIRRERGAYRALSHLCMENTQALGELCRQYEQAHGARLASLSDLVPLATNRTWIFSCALVDNPKFEKIESAGAEPSNGATSLRITYLYFTNTLEGVRILCPVWHPELTAGDETDSIRDVDRQTWERIRKRVTDRR